MASCGMPQRRVGGVLSVIRSIESASRGPLHGSRRVSNRDLVMAGQWCSRSRASSAAASRWLVRLRHSGGQRSGAFPKPGRQFVPDSNVQLGHASMVPFSSGHQPTSGPVDRCAQPVVGLHRRLLMKLKADP